jgi:hypothetical protein
MERAGRAQGLAPASSEEHLEEHLVKVGLKSSLVLPTRREAGDR